MKPDNSSTAVQSLPATMGERIKAVRTAWGWSQEQMAETLRVDQASISFWERDKIIPSGSAMVALSALIRCSIDALETGQGFVVPDPPSPAPLVDHQSLRSVSLRSSDEGAVGVVDLTHGTSKGKEVSETMMDLVESVKSGRRVWIAIE